MEYNDHLNLIFSNKQENSSSFHKTERKFQLFSKNCGKIPPALKKLQESSCKVHKTVKKRKNCCSFQQNWKFVSFSRSFLLFWKKKLRENSCYSIKLYKKGKNSWSFQNFLKISIRCVVDSVPQTLHSKLDSKCVGFCFLSALKNKIEELNYMTQGKLWKNWLLNLALWYLPSTLIILNKLTSLYLLKTL